MPWGGGEASGQYATVDPLTCCKAAFTDLVIRYRTQQFVFTSDGAASEMHIQCLFLRVKAVS